MTAVVVEAGGQPVSVQIGTQTRSYVTRALAEAATIPVFVTGVICLSYAEIGDAPVSAWVEADSAPAHGACFQSRDGRWWELVAADGIDLRVIGGKPDSIDTYVETLDENGIPQPNGEFDRDSTDNTPILAIAQAYSHAKGVPILLSGCTANTGYRVYKYQPTDTGYVNITGQYHHIRGSGPTTAKIFIDEDLAYNGGGYQAVFQDTDTTSRDPFQNPAMIHEGVEFRGRWHHALPEHWGASGNDGICAGGPIGRQVTVQNCEFNYIRDKGYRARVCRSVQIDNVRAYCCTEGLYRGLGSFNFQCTNTEIHGTSDDALDPAADDGQTFGPARSNILIDNVTFIDCQPLAIAGAKTAVLNNITMIRCKGGASINVEAVGNGKTTAFGYSVSNIVIEDMLEAYSDDLGALVTGTTGAAVNIGGGQTSAKITGQRPGRYDIVAKRFVLPWEASQTDYTGLPVYGAMYARINTTYPSIGGLGNRVSNITVMRTLPDTTDYWGGAFGWYFHKTGWKAPAVDSTKYRPNAIVFTGESTALSLNDFTIVGIPGAGVYIQSAVGTKDPKMSNRRVLISDGIIYGCKNGVVKDGTSSSPTYTGYYSVDIVVNNVHVTCDPWHTASIRKRDGSGQLTGGWTTDSTYDYRAFVVINGRGWHFENCSAAQCYEPFAFNSNTQQFTHRGTRVYCTPASPTFSESNLGVAVPGYGSEYNHVIEDLNPQSGLDVTVGSDTYGQPLDYGKLLNACKFYRSSIPTAGTWVQGAFVTNTQPAISSGKVLRGWSRLTTGASHTSGTDWTPVYESTS